MAYDPVTESAVRRAGERLTLLEQHEGAQALRPAAGAARWGADPAGFIAGVLGGDLWSGQRAIVAALRDHPMVAVKGCHGSGKDHVAARYALWWAYALRGRVILTAPTQHQLQDILMDGEVRRAFHASRPKLYGKLWAMSLEIPGEEYAGLVGLVSTKDARTTGLHAPRTLLLLTEANGIPTAIFDALLGNVMGPEDRVLALGNALATSESWFRRAFAPGSGWHAIALTADDVFNAGINVEGGRRVDGMITPAWVESRIKEYGRGSAFVQAKVYAQFPTVADQSVTTPEQLERAAVLWEQRGHRGPGPGDTLLLGVDVGRGLDASALAWASDGVVFGVEAFETADGPAVAARVLRKYAELESDPYGLGRPRVTGVVIDAIGVGASPVDLLAARGVPLTEFKGNERASDDFPGGEPSQYENKRAEAYLRLGAALATGTLALPRDPQLWEELLAHRWFVNERRGRLQILSKDDVRDALRRSPNKSDAVAMVVHELETGASIGGDPDVRF